MQNLIFGVGGVVGRYGCKAEHVKLWSYTSHLSFNPKYLSFNPKFNMSKCSGRLNSLIIVAVEMYPSSSSSSLSKLFQWLKCSKTSFSFLFNQRLFQFEYSWHYYLVWSVGHMYWFKWLIVLRRIVQFKWLKLRRMMIWFI